MSRPRECPCGSGLISVTVRPVKGARIGRVCARCREEKMRAYPRPVMDWAKVRAEIVEAIRYSSGPLRPMEPYFVRYGSAVAEHGDDTYELTERVLKLAKRDFRKTGHVAEIGS